MCSTMITGLLPESFSLSLAASSSPLYVNSNTSLILTFTLSDTISKSDYFQLVLPANSSFTFIGISSSNLGLFPSATTYVAANNTLVMRQSSSSSTKSAGTVCQITVGRYTAPGSTKTTSAFLLQIYNSYNGLKMQGSATVTAVAKAYAVTVVAGSYLINQNTSYSFVVNVTDSLLSSAMIQVRFPAELAVSVAANCLTNNNFSSTTTAACTTPAANTVLVGNITSAAVTPGVYSISIATVTNANRALTTSGFSLVIYYSDDTTAQVGTSSVGAVTMLSRELAASAISVVETDSTVSASGVTMNVSFVALDYANGYITITIPA